MTMSLEQAQLTFTGLIFYQSRIPCETIISNKQSKSGEIDANLETNPLIFNIFSNCISCSTEKNATELEQSNFVWCEKCAIIAHKLSTEINKNAPLCPKWKQLQERFFSTQFERQ